MAAKAGLEGGGGAGAAAAAAAAGGGDENAGTNAGQVRQEWKAWG